MSELLNAQMVSALRDANWQATNEPTKLRLVEVPESEALNSEERRSGLASQAVKWFARRDQHNDCVSLTEIRFPRYFHRLAGALTCGGVCFQRLIGQHVLNVLLPRDDIWAQLLPGNILQ